MTTTRDAPPDGAWVPLAEAATALHMSPDTVRRWIKTGKLPSKMQGNRYLVHVEAEQLQQAPSPMIVIDDPQPAFHDFLRYLRERDAQRDQEVAQLRADLAQAYAELHAAKAALPRANGKPWGPFQWLRLMWVAQDQPGNN